ncbi:uncharacterized protein DC041_0009042 [Schistosoma bovis]|uniref:Uncharacterized protein n=1 Tax=Schistosoma bovis TaxID=6184 RepID=A0A430PZZ6_SCHBO|nr:uncharacterized protein DC041_0009042 [Schistosoma bovis]
MKYIYYNPGELKRVIIHELGHTFVSETTINYTVYLFLYCILVTMTIEVTTQCAQ